MYSWNNASVRIFTKNESGVVAEETIHIAIRVFLILTMFISVFGNLLVILAVFANTRLRSLNGNRLLCSLAVADFLQGAVAVPMRIAETYPHYPHLLSCRVSIPFSIMFGGTSNVTILFISLERFLSIYFPYLYVHFITGRSVNLTIAFSWTTVGILSVMSASPLCWQKQQTHQLCSFPLHLSKEYLVVLYIYVHLIPLTFVTMIYGFILKASCSQHRRIHQQKLAVATNHTSVRTQSPVYNSLGEYLRVLKSVRIVTVVAGLFIILVSPIIVIDVMEIMQGDRPSQEVVMVTVCMIYANSCVNVFVYAGLNRDFRVAFKRILTRCFLKT